RWRAFARPLKRLKIGDTLAFKGIEARLAAKTEDGSIELVFSKPVLAALQEAGAMPLPPYIRDGIADERDCADYQTMFAKFDGSVAAPTAGLHFTPRLMEEIAAAGIRTATVTLHVGAGTFQPIRVDDTGKHKMHAEWGE